MVGHAMRSTAHYLLFLFRRRGKLVPVPPTPTVTVVLAFEDGETALFEDGTLFEI